MDIAGAVREFFSFLKPVVVDAIEKDAEELFRDAEREAIKDYEKMLIALRNGKLDDVRGMFNDLPKIPGKLNVGGRHKLYGVIDGIPKYRLAEWYASGRLGLLEQRKKEALQVTK